MNCFIIHFCIYLWDFYKFFSYGIGTIWGWINGNTFQFWVNCPFKKIVTFSFIVFFDGLAHLCWMTKMKEQLGCSQGHINPSNCDSSSFHLPFFRSWLMMCCRLHILSQQWERSQLPSSCLQLLHVKATAPGKVDGLENGIKTCKSYSSVHHAHFMCWIKLVP